ncbi:MAG TPA: CDP-alcohol phosphatidyltransferase family protein [Candidatus Binatia bacterium]|jgi:phosphatidylglycerophosphate synthase
MLGRAASRNGGVRGSRPLLVLPHLISLLRPAIGIAVLTIFGDVTKSTAVPVLVAAACASDWLDGRIARRLGLETATGRILDNLCDFAFLLCMFAFFARVGLWSPPVWGRLVRQWAGANRLPAYALLTSFGIYFVRLMADLARGREPRRTSRGHAAGIANYGLVLAGAAQMLPGVDLGPWLLEAAMVVVAIMNFAAVGENILLLAD